jgi:hypothetical protein
MKHKKLILREKLGRDVILAYDEQKRMLVVCGVDVQNVRLIKLITVLGADARQ